MRRVAVLVLLAAGCGDDEVLLPDAPLPDAPGSTCGLPAPGSQCASSALLERCDGADVEQVDCGETGRVCGADPANPMGAACVADGDACGVVTERGACAGTVLVWCSSGELAVVDCADAYAECDWQNVAVGFTCVTPCHRVGATTEGECMGDGAVRRCVFDEDGYRVEVETCPAGTTCQGVEETGWPACLPDPSCAGVGPQGRCDGDVRVTCGPGGAPVFTDCAAAGQVCGYGGDAGGYVCAPAGALGPRLLRGQVRYEDRLPIEGGLAPPMAAPARGVTVAVIREDTGGVLAVALTADDGSYTLRYDAPVGTPVYLLAATTSDSAARPARVIRPDGRVHGFAGPALAAGDDVRFDLLATDASGVAPAFNVFDMLVLGLDALRDDVGVGAIRPVYAQWVRGSGDGTYYDSQTGGIFLLGHPFDDDGYDDAVILHELGHYAEDAYGRSDSPGGSHDGSPTDPRLAWSEGFSTYLAGALRGDPVYRDANLAGGWSYDMDATVTPANPGLPVSQDLSEDTVSEILWDVADAPAGDDDPMTSGDHQAVLAVAFGYFPGGGWVDRGHSGVDLVDWLDGWFVANDLTSCAALRFIVQTVRAFPYDFAGPAGACP